MIYAIFVLTLLDFGGFHMWVKCVVGILIAFELLNTALKGKKKISFKQYTPLVLLFLMLITSFWSVDWSKNIEGILTGFVLFGWMLLWGVTDENDKEQLINLIPYLGAAMSVISLLALLFKSFPIQLWQAERLGGFFQYSNTCALFLGLCIILEANKRSKRKVKSNINDAVLSAVVIVILALGLLLTGSRGMLILMFGWAIYKLVKDKLHRKIFAIGIVSSLALIIIAAAIGKNSQNLARFASILSSNSTIWGRILYYIDGIRMLITHPFGMGYMGYYYVQGSMQTGVYTTKFVHNELLQMGLDYGIVAMFLVIAYLIIQLLKGKQAGVYKEYLAMIIIASMIDFNLQYMLMLMLLVLCLDLKCDFSIYGKFSGFLKNKKNDEFRILKKPKKKSVKQDENTLAIMLCFVSIIFMGYWLFVYGSIATGDYVTSNKVFSYNTDSIEYLLGEAKTTSEAIELSDKLLSINKYSVAGWLYRAYATSQSENYEEFILCGNKIVELNKYDVNAYNTYGRLIDSLLADAILDEKMRNKLSGERNKLPNMLRALEENTSSIAYKIKDKPVFELQ